MSTPHGSDVSLSVIVAALRDEVQRTSLRAVAKEVGMTATGVDWVLKSGGTNRLKTEGKLRSWFVRHVPAGSTDEETARAALTALLAGIPEGEKRERTVRAILDAVEGAHAAHRRKPPEWLERVRGSG